MGTCSQKARNIAIKLASFGEDDFLLSKITEGSEGLSELFNYKLEMLSEGTHEPSKLLGMEACIRIASAEPGAEPRYVDGIISSVVFEGVYAKSSDSVTLFQYSAELSPLLWLATHSLKRRVFHDKTPIAIVEDILKNEYGVAMKYAPGMDGKDYLAYEQCVQFDESDFSFASRLLESAGVFYFFEHSQGKHVMTLCNANPKVQDAKLQYNPKAGADTEVSSWRMGERIAAQAFNSRMHRFSDVGTDYKGDAKTAQKSVIPKPEQLAINAISSGFPLKPDLKDADKFPGKFKAELLGRSFRSSSYLWSGETKNRAIVPGLAFALERYPVKCDGFLVRRCKIKASTTPYANGAWTVANDTEFSYACSFVCCDQSAPFLPENPTPEPKAAMPSIGKIITYAKPEDDAKKLPEALVDGQLRVKVRFDWGWPAANDDRQICFARVLQPKAGKGYGSFTLPRNGQEAVVEFMDGNPDIPIVTGTLFNNVMKPPLDLAKQDSVYANCIREESVMADGTPAAELKPAELPKEIAINELYKADKRLKYNEIGVYSVVSKFKEKETTDYDVWLSEFGATKDIGSFIKDIRKAKDEPKQPNTCDGLEGVNIYSNHTVLSQAAQNQVMKAGRDIVIEAANTITLKVGNSEIVLTEKGIDLRFKSQLMNNKAAEWTKNVGWIPMSTIQAIPGVPSIESFDAAISLKAFETEMSGFKTAMKGVWSAGMSSYLASAECKLYSFETEACKIEQSASGILAKADKLLCPKGADGVVKSAEKINKIVQGFGKDLGKVIQDKGAKNKNAAVFGGLNAVVGTGAKLYAYYKMIKTIIDLVKSPANWSPTKTSITMDSLKLETSAMNTDMASIKYTLKGDPTIPAKALAGIVSKSKKAQKLIFDENLAKIMGDAVGVACTVMTLTPLTLTFKTPKGDEVDLVNKNEIASTDSDQAIAQGEVKGAENQSKMLGGNQIVTDNDLVVSKTDSEVSKVDTKLSDVKTTGNIVSTGGMNNKVAVLDNKLHGADNTL